MSFMPGSRWRDRAHLPLGGLRLRPRERALSEGYRVRLGGVMLHD